MIGDTCWWELFVWRPLVVMPWVYVLYSIPSLAVMAFYLSPLWAIILSAVVLDQTLQWITGHCNHLRGSFIDCHSDLHTTCRRGTQLEKKVIALLLSLGAGFGYAGFLTTCRSAQRSCPDLPMNFATAAGNSIASASGFVCNGRLSVEPPWSQIALNSGCCF